MRFRLTIRIAIGVAAILLWTGWAISAKAFADEKNLLVNGGLTATVGDSPTGWKTTSLPGCGFRFELHRNGDAPNEFEIINDQPAESSFQQSAQLDPGWYHFSAEIKVDSLGSAGAEPELFVRSPVLSAVHNTAHLIGWSNGWQKVQMWFKTGEKVRQVDLGLRLGVWGSPNTGRVLIRNLALVAEEPENLGKSGDLEAAESRDLEELAERNSERFDERQRTTHPTNYYILGRPWSLGVLYIILLAIGVFGWLGLSPPRAAQLDRMQ